jgi:membrane protein
MRFFKSAARRLIYAAYSVSLFVLRSGRRNLRILRFAGREFGKEHCVIRAAALSFASSLALVPVGIVFLLFGKWVGFFALSDIADWVRGFLIKRLLPPRGADEAAAYITRLVDEYLNRASGQISGISILSFGALVITTMLFLLTIEKSFNDIWAVTIKRSLLKRVRNVLLIITLGPILIFFSFFFGARFYSTLMEEVSRHSHLNTLAALAPPFLFSIFVFYLLYQFVPYTAVKMKAALKGALIAGVIWELVKLPFTLYVTNVLNLEQVYGQIGFVPVFLLWLYLTWVLVLFGAEISFCDQNLHIVESQDPRESRFASGLREYFSVRIAQEVAQASRGEGGCARVRDIARSLRVPRSFVIEISEKLRKKGFFYSEKEKSAYKLALPEERITLGNIIFTVAPVHLEVPETAAYPFDEHLRELFTTARSQLRSSLYRVTLAEVLKARNNKME